MKILTVGELKKAIDGVPDEIEVRLSSDTGVDQGEGEIIVESAMYIKYNSSDGTPVEHFDIYANDHDDFEEDEC